MNPFVKFFHELINPHCSHCETLRIQELEQQEINRETEIAQKVCQSCENLKMQLAFQNQLIDKLTNEPLPETTTISNVVTKPIQTGYVPWNVTRQRLEMQSRLKAESLKAEASIKIPEPDKIEELEKELGIVNGPTT